MAMAAANILTISSLLLLLFITTLPSPTAAAAEPQYHPATAAFIKPRPEKQTDVVVEGVVYCQSCRNAGSWSLTAAKPIPSARVSVTCKNSRHQAVSFYKVYQTDDYGYFYAELDGLRLGHGLLDHPLQACTVKLVSSPLVGCNVRTNVNYGLDGAQLRFEGKVLRSGYGYEAVVYAAGPLAFRPSQCYGEEGEAADVHA